MTSCNGLQTCRTLPGLLSSCGSTVFLCTWATLHLDVPEDPDESLTKNLCKRIGWTLVAFLAPEVILFMAWEDWTESCGYLARILDKHPDCGWTEMHAMFARMGGFRLVSQDGTTMQPLVKEQFLKVVEEGLIDIPTVSLSAIQEKSKSDIFAKTFAVSQTVWFFLQTINRVADGYQLTQLELSTLAYVVLYLLISWCWWNKPMDVRFPIDVCQKTQVGQSGEDITILVIADDESPSERRARLCRRLPLRVRMGAYFARTRDLTLFKALFLSLLYLMAGGLFGAIHCVAWKWLNSGTLWRVSAVYVTVFPDISLVLSWWLREKRTCGLLIAVVLSLAYTTARMSLLVITFLALRSLPPGVFDSASWSIHIPHIG